MKPKKIKSHIKVPSNNEQEKPNEIDLFSTLYGDNPTFDQVKELKSFSKLQKNVYNDDNRSPRRYKTKNNPIAPIDINLNSPRVIVPQPKPIKPNSKSNLFKNAKSKLIPEPSPRRILHQSFDHPKPPPTPSTNPRISNDHLTMFDDTTYDDQQFLQNIISLINSNEPVLAKSLFYHQNGQCEWRKCYVVGYNEPRFIIKFDPESSKTKEVPRVAIKFDLDDQKRFENRRNEAYSNRIEVDTQLRLETYLYSRAMKTKGVSLDAEILKSIIKKIGQINRQKVNKNRSNEKEYLNMINNLVPEINDNFLFADAFAQFVLEWENPKAAEKFTKSGLERIKLETKPWKNSPRKLEIEMEYSKKVVLPDQALLQQIVDQCNSFKNKDFLIFMFKQIHPPIQLSYFFEQLKFEVNASASDARVNLKMNLTKLLKTIIQNLNRKISEKFETMVNLRYKEVLASIINHVFINTYDMMKKYKVTFDISVESDLKTIHPSFEAIEKFGIESMEFILKTYENNKTPEIEVLGKDPQLLSISFDYLNENYEKAKQQYLELLEKDKKVFEKAVKNLLDVTQSIPVNPEKATKEILKGDYFKDDLTEEDIDFDLIREKLNNAKSSYNRFLLTFSEQIESDLCTFDIKQFYQSTINNYDQFYSLIFNQLELIADYQTSKIYNNVEMLENKSGKASNTIEEWYEKHCILLEIRSNVRKIENKLNFVLSIINFMTDFQYQPQHDYSFVINVKKKLLNVYLNIKQYNELDHSEKVEFIKIHKKSIEDFQKELEDFHVDLMNFHYIKSDESNYPLLIKCKENYDKIIDKMNLYHSRDSILELQKTEYQLIDILQTEIDDILSVWTIGHKLETDVENWLTIPFRELDIKNITQSLVDWRSKLETLHNKMEEEKSSSNYKDEDDLVIPTIENYQSRIKELIQHLPIVTAMCNKHLRGRHWYKINSISTIHIDINEGLTWNWLIECGIEDYMLAIQAICRTADSEFQIESALSEMVDELQTMRLRVNEENGVLRLEEPSYAMIMLGKHQQKLQEIFIPPHVHPFLERIHDYNVLATNLRQILKQTIEAQQKIDELKPAMDSNDIRTQHEEMAVKFDNQVQKFNEFTGSFKMSLSFHQILGSERYMNISSELLTSFTDIRENLGIVLEEKRKICPRFRLLSDNQLVFLLSNCNKPSVTKKVFSLMYSNVKKILLENENYCVGFLAKSGEKIMFENKIRVTPEAIEKWHLEFDNEIKRTMKKMTQVVINQVSNNLEKVFVKFPIQIICLVYETIFTSNINKAFNSFESNFLDNKRQNIFDFLQNYLSSITKDISIISELYKKLKIKSISSLILTLLNQRDLLTKMIQNKVDSSSNHFWYSNTKFVISNQDSDDLSISVQIGPISYDYGFEYTGIQRLIIKTSNFNHLLSNFLLSVSNSIIPLFYADVESRKTETVIDFAAFLGYNPFVHPCYLSTTIEKLKSAIKNARECNEFLILEGIDKLMPNTLNELSVLTFCGTDNNKTPIVATYSVSLKENSSEVPEQLKLYYRPIHLKSIDLEKKYKLILESLLICNSKESCEYASSRFAYLTQTVSKLFRPPLNTILMENSIIQFFRNHPSVSIEELVQSFIVHVKSYLVEYDINEMLEYINFLFNDLEIDFDPAVDYNINEDLIKTKNKENEIEFDDEFDQNILYTFKSHYGIIVLGRAMTGKTALIEQVANKMKKKLLYINPFSITMENLYGDKSSGLLSSLLTENGTDQWIVFDGSCRADWMELASYVLINNNRRMKFGDGSMLVLASSFRIIFETDDISMASPLTLGACTTIYVNEDRISLTDRLNKYIEHLSNETRIIEPLSNTIVGSTISASNLIDIVQSFFDHFVPKVSEFVESLNCKLTVSKVAHFVTNFFECFHCSLLNYYVPEKNHSADDLLKDSPNLLLFALIWSYGGAYDNENRIQISDFLIEISEQYIQSINSNLSVLSINENNDNKKVYLFDCYYDEESHLWKNWIEQESILPDLMEVSPYSIFIPNNSLISVYSISKSLIHQNMNILLFGDDANHITPYVNLCLNSNHFLSEMTVILCNSFGEINVDKVIQSFLPDLDVTNGLSIRYPLLALLGIDIASCNRNSELLRFIMEHKFFRNNKTFVDESVPSLRTLLTTDKNEINPRLSHFCFFLNIDKEDNQVLKDSFAYSIEKMWRIDSNISSFISNILIQTLEKAQCESPHFDFNSLQLIFQKITENLRRDESKNCCLKNIIENLSKELSFTFYESTRSENILSIINDMNLRLINQYNEFSCNNEDDSISFIPEKSVNFESHDESLKFDINSMAKLLKTFRSNVVVKSDSREIPFNIIEKTCSNNDIFIRQKNLEEDLLKAYHDCFIHAGMMKKHSVLLLDDSILQKQEIELLNLILKNSNIFGLFSKGEKMKLMSEIHCKDANTYDEETIETAKSFNFLLSEFIINCEKYCHIVIVSHSQNESIFQNVSVYLPLTQSVTDERLLHLKDLLQTNLPHLFDNYPYLLSDKNLNFILTKIDEKERKIKKKVDSINERFSILKESKEINDSFLQEYLIKMKNTEIDIKQLNKELKVSMENLQHLQEISEQQTIAFEKEAEELKVEESKVQILRKECENQLSETKAILETASQEVKHLSSRDTAVIKGMNHPPKGVVLVVVAMCIVMDIDIDYKEKKEEDLTAVWTKGKSVMNDPSFLNKLITSALDLLSPLIIKKIEPIVNDPNFEPTIIEKSSSAAKSICIFIRSLIPYYNALNIYKEKNSQMREMEEKLEKLIEKQNEAMQKLTLSKNKCMENQMKIEKLTQTKKSYEDQLTNQREKIGFYQKFQEIIESYMNEKFEFFTNKINKSKVDIETLFIKQIFKDLCGPFTDSQRNELLLCLQDNLNQVNQTRESLLFCDNSVVKKWHKFQYPISQFWKENTSLMAPEGGRWVVVEGLRCCSSSYLKKVLNSPNLPTLSVFSVTFEKDFIQMIQKSNRIIITDYDFNHPSLIVSLVYKSIENEENEFIYQNEEITFQKDLIVYFDVDSLPSVSYIDFGPSMVNLRVGSAISSEQISLALFQLKSQFSDIQRNESSIFSNRQQIDEIEGEIEHLLTENRIEIFDSYEIQKRFIDKSNERSKIINDLNELKETHIALFETFSETLEKASEICQSFEKFPIQTSIWKIYEDRFQMMPTLNVETIKSSLTTVILSSLPSKLRMRTILSVNSILPENFDNDFEKVVSFVGNNEMLRIQSPQSIINETVPNRPAFLVSPSSQFEICSLINYLKDEDKKSEQNFHVFDYSDDISTVIQNSMSKGSIVAILLNSIDDVKNSISAISIVLSQSVLNQFFRLFLIVTFPLHHENDIISHKIFLPSIVTFCDTFYFAQPFNASSIFTQLNPSNKVSQKLAVFHSVSSIIRKFKFCGKVHEFSSFLLAKKCIEKENSEIQSDEIGAVEIFVSLFIYGDGKLSSFVNKKKEGKVDDYMQYLAEMWNAKIRMNSELDSPENFGLSEHDFDFYKDRFYIFSNKRKNQTENKKNGENNENEEESKLENENSLNVENFGDESKDNEIINDGQTSQDENEDAVNGQSSEKDAEGKETIDEQTSQNETENDQSSEKDAESKETIDDQSRQSENENSVNGQSSDKDAENKETVDDETSQNKIENDQSSKKDAESNQVIDDQSRQSENENSVNDQSSEKETVDDQNDDDRESTESNEYESRDDEIIIISNGSYSNTSNDDYETRSESSIEKTDCNQESSSSEEADFSLSCDSNVYRFEEEDEDIQNGLQNLMTIDLAAATEIPRNLSHEFDFAEAKLRSISEGKSSFTPFFQHQLMQLINVPEFYDMSLFVSPLNFFEITKSEFLKINGFYSKTVLMIEDHSKYYEELLPCGTLCKGIAILNASFVNGQFAQFDGFTSLNEFWLKPVSYDTKLKLSPVPFYKDGKIVDFLYIRFNGNSDELKKIVLINDV